MSAPVASPRGGGGKLGNLSPTSDRTPREIDADQRRFSCPKKVGGRFTAFAPKFYMHRRYGGRSLVLRLRKRWGCGSCWSYSGRPSVKLRGPIGSFSPGIGSPRYNIFILFYFIFKCEFGVHPKKL